MPSRRTPWTPERAPPPTGASPSTRPSTASARTPTSRSSSPATTTPSATPKSWAPSTSAWPPRLLAGCSGQAVITTGREIEGAPGLTILSLSLPGAELTLKRVSAEDLDAETPLVDHLLPPDDVNAWILLSDPFTIDSEKLVAALAEVYPGTPILGGMASAFPGGRSAYLFEGGNLAPGGALLLAIGGGWTVHPVVSQGAAPIGESWTITEAERNIVVAIGGRPALDVLMETLRALPPDVQERAGRNLLCGLAMDEYADELGRGDFLIRNLLGVDRERGAVAINDNVRVGQTLQFQLRDAEAATEELNALLDKAREAMGGRAGRGPALRLQRSRPGHVRRSRPRCRRRCRPPRPGAHRRPLLQRRDRPRGRHALRARLHRQPRPLRPGRGAGRGVTRGERAMKLKAALG